jgi:hypothetical protein
VLLLPLLLLLSRRSMGTSASSLPAACRAILPLRLCFAAATAELLLSALLVVGALPLAGACAALFFTCTLLRLPWLGAQL